MVNVGKWRSWCARMSRRVRKSAPLSAENGGELRWLTEYSKGGSDHWGSLKPVVSGQWQ